MRYGHRTGTVVGGQDTGRVMVKDSKSGNVGSYKRESLTRIDSSPPSSAPTLRPEPADSPVWQKPNTDLSDQDKQDMYNYAWDYQSYHALNEPLRDGSLPSDPQDRALLDRLTSLIDRSSLPADATLYRAAFSAEDLIQQIQQAHANGDTWTEPGFMSTSLDPAKAAEMDNGDSADAAIYFDIGIDAPKGTKALVFDGALADRPDAYDQQEVLLQRGSQFRVDSLTKGADGWHAKMTLVNQPTPKASEGPSEPRGAIGTPAGGAGTGEGLPGAPEPTGAPEEGVPGNGGPHNGIYTSTDPATPYTVITQHGENREVRTRHFPTHEAAQAYAEAHNPDTDGSMVPNIDSGIGSHPNYSRGFFHAKVNRYAVIHKHGNNQEGGEPYYGGPRVPHRSFDGTPPKPRSTNMDKLWESGAPIRYRHKTIPSDSPYHMFHVSTGRYDDGKRRAETATKGPVAISKDEVVPVTVSPDELNEMPLYTDLIDRATAKGWAYYGWDPATDMVLVQDPADGYEKWIPRKQLVARFLPGKWY